MEIRPGNAWCQGNREEQQDAFGFSSFDDAALRSHAGVLVMLADGMGGMSSGGEASRIAVQQMMAAYTRKGIKESIPQALDRALTAANRAVYELALARAGEGQVGTTLVAAVVHGDEVHWISAGDSRLYLYQAADRTLTRCTDDHTHANDLRDRLARGEDQVSEGLDALDPAALVSFLGLREVPKVDRSGRPRALAVGDRLLLCSDGVYGTLPEAEIAALLHQDAQPAAEALIRSVQARAAPNQDNATAAVLGIGETPAQTRAGQGAAAQGLEPLTNDRTRSDRRTSAGALPPALRAPRRPAPRLARIAGLGIAAICLIALGIWIGMDLGGKQSPAPPPAGIHAEPAVAPTEGAPVTGIPPVVATDDTRDTAAPTGGRSAAAPDKAVKATPSVAPARPADDPAGSTSSGTTATQDPIPAPSQAATMPATHIPPLPLPELPDSPPTKPVPAAEAAPTPGFWKRLWHRFTGEGSDETPARATP